MTKGPLTIAALVVATILIVFSTLIVLFRDYFVEHMGVVVGVTGIVVLIAISILTLMFYRLNKMKK